MRVLSIFSLLLSLNVVFGARILCVYTVTSISHQIVFRALTKELARRGHELVIITSDPYLPKERPADNVREIDVSTTYSYIKNAVSRMAGTTNSPIMDFHNILLKACLDCFDAQLDFPEVKELIQNRSERFDLLILEAVVRPVFFFTHRFKAPVIGFSSLTGVLFNYDATGTPNDPLLYPGVFQKKISNLTLWDKIETIATDWYQRYSYWRSADEENAVGRKHFGADTPDIQELANNMDLLLLNVNPVWEGPRPTPPSVIYVGGLHIQPPKELPEDLKSYLDSCSRGVLYMSLGSNVKSSELPVDKLETFLRVFGELPHCVLWKWESDSLAGKPDNVRIGKWLPQADLLAHPNILAFITQGGLQSTDEAIDRGVPLIGLPFLGDQEKNVLKYVHHGIGIALNIESLDENNLRNAISSIINDESYRNNMRRLKSLMSDQPSSALERAAWWVEYLLRHGTARHLQAPRIERQFGYWPLGALLVASISVCVHVAYAIRVLCRNSLRKSKDNTIKEKIN